ncbi:hypothetical protein [Vagococcus fluvialis]|uniref:hypothetical protein n=1 Tax=Vagococcus fluvialis TaxID=2738 RepID=UPI00379CC248
MIKKNVYDCTRPRRLGIRGSIVEGDSTRYTDAKDEIDNFQNFQKSFKCNIDMLIYLVDQVNYFLEQLSLETYSIQEIIKINGVHFNLSDKKNMKNFYDSLKNKYDLNDERHLVWLKFTKNGCLGVVAAGADINFDSENTSGKIINYVHEEWDEELVLVFPLSKIGFGFRRDIECGIGNYLLDLKVPILDKFSHMY